MSTTISGSTTYKRRHGLTIQQRNAIDLLVTGQTDAAVATAVGVNPTTVSKWRLYDPLFQVELNRRRLEVWSGAADSLRSLFPVALETMRDQLRAAHNRGRLALDFFARAGLMGKPGSGALGPDPLDGHGAATSIGSIELDDLLDQEVRRHRAEYPTPTAPSGEGTETPPGVPAQLAALAVLAARTAPITDDERAAALERLLARAAPDDEAPA